LKKFAPVRSILLTKAKRGTCTCCLTPDGLGLRLNAAHSAIHHAGTVRHAHRALDFNREVDVAGGIIDVDAVLEARLSMPFKQIWWQPT
jgi:hypothetical protein